MTRRAEMEQGEHTPAVSGGSSGQSYAQQPGVREVSPAAFMIENPGFITISKSGG